MSSGTAPDSLRTAPIAERMGGPRSILQHGRWTLEIRGDEVADITYDGVLLLRAIRPVVRDQDWNTVPVRVVATASGNGAETVVELRFQAEQIRYAATLTVALSSDELLVGFDGTAEAAFLRNRIGLVVLHPASEAGREVSVRHTSGSVTQGRWPDRISPHQPFTDIAGFAWTRDEVVAELTLSGSVFENEDQRNWTDASFKTYSTPLEEPFPVPVVAGDRVRQQARLQITDRAASSRSRLWNRDVVTVGDVVVGQLPPLSLCASLYPPPQAPTGLAGYECVLVELVDLEESWPALLATAAGQAAAMGADLDVRLVARNPETVARAVNLLHDLPVRRLAVFDPTGHLSSPPLWAALRRAAQRSGFRGDLLGGTRAHFTEFNRGQSALPDDLPALTFSLTPSMHATELPHLLDSLATQRTVAENAVQIAAGRPVHVGPVTLAPRFNAVATGNRPDPATEARHAVDSLQHTNFAAAWTLASVQALSVPGIASITYYETVGDRGLILGQQLNIADLSPAGRVLGLLARAAGRSILDAEASTDLAALPLVRSGRGGELLLANLSGDDRQVLVRWGGQLRSVPLSSWAVTRVDLS